MVRPDPEKPVVDNREALVAGATDDPGEDESATRRRALALDCVARGIRAATPERVLEASVTVAGERLTVDGTTYDLAAYDRLVVVGGGKAAGRVAAVLEGLLGDRIDGGVVVTDTPAPTDSIAGVEGSHPLPDAAGADGAGRVLELVERADERTLVLATITGGGSALLPAPAGELSLSDLRTVTEALLSVGASIDEINAVRKHCSAIKGGQLARRAAPATVATLAFSDVVGDDPSVIASGPTVPDASTYGDALAVLDRYGIDAPAAVREHLEAGTAGDRPETPGADDAVFDTADYHLLANAHTALEAARAVANEAGYEPCLLAAGVRGESREAARTAAAVTEEVLATGNPVPEPAVVLSGGETTVTVRGDGTGGPNQEFALSAAAELAGVDGWTLACVDTDGRDGATDAAGALVDGTTVGTDPEARRAVRAALADNDAGTFLADRDALIETGPTGTNVNDLRVLVVSTAANGG